MKAVRLKSSGQSVGRRMIYGGKDLWNRCVLSLEWKREEITQHCRPHSAATQLIASVYRDSACDVDGDKDE